MTEWYRIENPEEAPGHGRIVLLWAVTERSGDGTVTNWKMATGNWSKYSGWNWEGRYLDKPYHTLPTHWQHLPEPPHDS